MNYLSFYNTELDNLVTIMENKTIVEGKEKLIVNAKLNTDLNNHIWELCEKIYVCIIYPISEFKGKVTNHEKLPEITKIYKYNEEIAKKHPFWKTFIIFILRLNFHNINNTNLVLIK